MASSEDLHERLSNMGTEELERLCKLFIDVMDAEICKCVACRMLGCSHATFERYVAKEIVPKSIKHRGDTKHYWKMADILSLLMKRME